MKIFGWPADTGGCAWYRIIAPLTTLQETSNTEVQVDQIMPPELLSDDDWLIVLQRSTNPTAMMALEYFAENNRKWVYDIDDLLWAVEPCNPAYNYYAQDVVRQRLRWHMENSPIATASTANLAEEMRFYGAKNVHVLPNTLPRRVLDNIASIIEETPRDDRLTIFWRGSPTHKNDIKTIRYAIKRLSGNKDIRIVLAGTDYRKELGVPDAEFMQWEADPEQYLYAVARIRPDIALCPLEHNRFNYSKSHVNALEAAAMGAIPLCTNTFAYKTLITDQENGFLLSSNEHDWDKTLQMLINTDRSDLEALQKAASESVNPYITENWTQEYMDVYRTAF